MSVIQYWKSGVLVWLIVFFFFCTFSFNWLQFSSVIFQSIMVSKSEHSTKNCSHPSTWFNSFNTLYWVRSDLLRAAVCLQQQQMFYALFWLLIMFLLMENKDAVTVRRAQWNTSGTSSPDEWKKNKCCIWRDEFTSKPSSSSKHSSLTRVNQPLDRIAVNKKCFVDIKSPHLYKK